MKKSVLILAAAAMSSLAGTAFAQDRAGAQMYDTSYDRAPTRVVSEVVYVGGHDPSRAFVRVYRQEAAWRGPYALTGRSTPMIQHEAIVLGGGRTIGLR